MGEVPAENFGNDCLHLVQCKMLTDAVSAASNDNISTIMLKLSTGFSGNI
jgi:hypothetical protein